MIDWRVAQTRLAKAGLYRGKIDGARGMVTIRALRDFAAQRDTGGVGDEIAADALANWDAFGMTSPLRLSEFLAQTEHKTRGFRVFAEDLRYSAAALLRTWPTRFTPTTAAQFAGKPQAIANLCAAGRGEHATRRRLALSRPGGCSS